MTGLNRTTIQWVHPDPDHRWTSNPIWGCSNGCPYCYARDCAHRFKMAEFTQPRYYPDRLDSLAWILARYEANEGIFVCSMGDPCGPLVNPLWVDALLEVIWSLPQHTFYLLTKRPDLIRGKFHPLALSHHTCPQNLVLGVSVEDRTKAWRIDALLDTWPGRTMVCYGPILGPPPQIPPGVDWLVMEGLSPQTRWLPEGWSSMHALHEASAIWAREATILALAKGIPVFHKTHPCRLPGVSEIQEWPEGWVSHPEPQQQPQPVPGQGVQLGLF